MKSAKEQFEELGYKIIKPSKNEEHLIIYEKYQRQFDETSRITFNTSGRVISKELNDEVEIIEEDKKIEKIMPTSLKGIDNLDEKIEIAHIDTISAIDKINEIIKVINEMREDK